MADFDLFSWFHSLDKDVAGWILSAVAGSVFAFWRWVWGLPDPDVVDKNGDPLTVQAMEEERDAESNARLQDALTRKLEQKGLYKGPFA